MSKMSDILPADNIAQAVEYFKDKKFNEKKFFELVGLKPKSKDVMKKVFNMLDRDNSGSIEEEFLIRIMKGFAPEGRLLIGKEVEDLLIHWDKNRDGKLSEEEFIYMVVES